MDYEKPVCEICKIDSDVETITLSAVEKDETHFYCMKHYDLIKRYIDSIRLE
jgi:hypothetical protein